MSYGSDKGKYQKAYDFLFAKLVPPSGKAMNELGEALRIVSKVYYRRNNDGDTYYDCIEEGMVQDLSKKIYPFNKEYHSLGLTLNNLLDSGRYDDAVSLVLVQIMLSLSSESNIYNPASNRLVPIESLAGRNALKALDLNMVVANYCGKNAEWLPESLKKEGVKITKVLSEETRKELNCDTINEFFTNGNQGSKTVKVQVTLSKDNTILSKKFSKIKAQHKKSVKAAEKQLKDSRKRREQSNKKQVKATAKNLKKIKDMYQALKELSPNKRVDSLEHMLKNKLDKDSMVKMLLYVLIEYKKKKVTKKAQRETCKQNVERLTKGLNEAGDYVVQDLGNLDDFSMKYYRVSINSSLNEKLDNMLVEMLGSSKAVDEVYRKIKYM